MDEVFDAYISFEIDDTEPNEIIYIRAHIEKGHDKNYIAILNYNVQQAKLINDYLYKKQMEIIREINDKIF